MDNEREVLMDIRIGCGMDESIVITLYSDYEAVYGYTMIVETHEGDSKTSVVRQYATLAPASRAFWTLGKFYGV